MLSLDFFVILQPGQKTPAKTISSNPVGLELTMSLSMEKGRPIDLTEDDIKVWLVIKSSWSLEHKIEVKKTQPKFGRCSYTTKDKDVVDKCLTSLSLYAKNSKTGWEVRTTQIQFNVV